MRTADVLRVTLAAGAVVLLAAGCNSTVDGEPTTQGDGATSAGSPAAVEVFNPCEMSDATLTSVGLDPATKDVSIDPPSGPSTWRVCAWKPLDKSETYRVDVFSTSHTLDEARKNENLTVVSDVTIGGREGITSYDKNDSKRDRCYATFAAEQGMFEIAVTWRGDSSDMPDMCTIAVDQATKLEPHLPE
ncbi:DUF3558 domain-containing protein [Nocardia cyriacigeorgica]|uniref:DUF3558 domain-containing protein n=1 Tax=Nocardia cyriacigeorgica TaxID=135487 RepID=UPI002458DFCD|nr:DUF3558 domain-containing protein [Nocardia cyriacigeorgica]